MAPGNAEEKSGGIKGWHQQMWKRNLGASRGSTGKCGVRRGGPGFVAAALGSLRRPWVRCGGPMPVAVVLRPLRRPYARCGHVGAMLGPCCGHVGAMLGPTPVAASLRPLRRPYARCGGPTPVAAALRPTPRRLTSHDAAPPDFARRRVVRGHLARRT